MAFYNFPAIRTSSRYVPQQNDILNLDTRITDASYRVLLRQPDYLVTLPSKSIFWSSGMDIASHAFLAVRVYFRTLLSKSPSVFAVGAGSAYLTNQQNSMETNVGPGCSRFSFLVCASRSPFPCDSQTSSPAVWANSNERHTSTQTIEMIVSIGTQANQL